MKKQRIFLTKINIPEFLEDTIFSQISEEIISPPEEYTLVIHESEEMEHNGPVQLPRADLSIAVPANKAFWQLWGSLSTRTEERNKMG